MMVALDRVVTWGRSFDEYVAMFALSEQDLQRPVLGCGDGPSSFAAELTARGGTAVSVDPIYRFTADEIQRRIMEAYPLVLEQARSKAHLFVWDSIPSVEALGRVRMAAMNRFITDYSARRSQGGYVAAELPNLPFSSGSFGLAVCSHLLFLYSGQFDESFHVRSIAEMCRVAREVRVFPLLALNAKHSAHLRPVTQRLQELDYDVRIENVPYEFQKGGNEMLRIAARI